MLAGQQSVARFNRERPRPTSGDSSELTLEGLTLRPLLTPKADILVVVTDFRS